ncbi:general substrate transporter [Coniochaeta sp. 2T2.1]|nr:general substrate transporter [Coniochaeta sp. 2T2.1]
MFESKVRGKVIKRILAAACGISFFMYGYDAGVLGGIQDTAPFRRAMGNPTGTYVIPMIASAYTLAAAVCSLVVVFIGMPLGRRGCVLMGNAFVIAGGSLQASAWSVPHMIVGRILCGFGIGFISCSIPTFQAEMAVEDAQRGPDVAVTGVFLITGIAVAYWLDFGFTRMDNQVSWRFPIGLQVVFALVAGGLTLLLPDTPRWYYAKGFESKGDATLARLLDSPLDDPRLLDMKQSILASIKLEEADERGLRIIDLIWDNTDLRAGRRIRISFFVLSIQQMMGINVSVYYSTIIFSNIGLSPFLSQLLAAVMNTVFALSTVGTVLTLERWGRRNIMMYSAAALTVCLAVFVAMIGLPNPTTATQWVSVAAIVVYNAFFGYGWISVPWLYGPEIAPLRLRHAGAAAGAFGEWIFSFITVFAGGIALQEVGWKIWLWMLLSCFLAIFFVYFMCPDTTGKSLEEIDLIFAKEHVRDSILASAVVRHNDGKGVSEGSVECVEV